jgi:hypothetical protein
MPWYRNICVCAPTVCLHVTFPVCISASMQCMFAYFLWCLNICWNNRELQTVWSTGFPEESLCHSSYNMWVAGWTTWAVYVERNIEGCSCGHCYSGKAIIVANCECVCVALVIQNTMCMHHIIFSSVACLALPYISTISHKWHDFQKKLLNVKCVFWFPLQHIWNISHSKKNSLRYYKRTYAFM